MEKYFTLFFIICLGFLILIIELIRRKHLREKYALLWLTIVIALPIVFFNTNLVENVSNIVGIKYPPTLVFIAAILGLLVLTLMLSVIDSHQTDRIIKLTQKMAILEKKLRDLSGDKKNSNKNN